LKPLARAPALTPKTVEDEREGERQQQREDEVEEEVEREAEAQEGRQPVPLRRLDRALCLSAVRLAVLFRLGEGGRRR
jgi:hypothetical protein